MKVIKVPAPDMDTIAGRYSIRTCTPWIVPESLEYLVTLVESEFNVFEYGNGGSTIWFAEHCAYVVGVEASPRWWIWTNEELKERSLLDKALVVPCFHAPGDRWLEDYTNTIQAYHDNYFDLVSVDGVAQVRQKCLEFAMDKLKPGGVLLVDNSNWYHDEHELPDWNEIRWITETFHFLGSDTEWATSILIKPEL